MSAYLEALEPGRCQKWKLVVSVGSGAERKRHTRTFSGGKREAQAALKHFEIECEDMPKDGTPTLASFSRQWNSARCGTGAITKSTFSNYEKLLGGLCLHIGDIELSKIAANDIETALAALKLGDSPSGKPWSGTSLKTAYKVLNKMMQDAQARGYVKSNPCASVKAPKADTKRRKALSLDESSLMLSTLDVKDAHQFAVALMLRTGMRAGECLGIKWNDVTDTGIVISREVTKTDSGARVIPLDFATREMIDKRREYIEKILNSANDTLQGTERLCCNNDGCALTYNALKHWWANHRADYNMSEWTLHELRHSFATNLAQANVHPSTMASLLGHSSSEITMEIYTHVHREDMEKAMNVLADARNVAPKSAPCSET